MTDELKQWEYDKGYTKGYSDGRASLIEELEKIKEEIEGINKSNDSMYCVGVTNALIILDRNIAELKGEEKTGKWEADWCVSVELPKYVCSVCGEAVWLKTDRCPKCKAIMKGERTNDSV